MKKIMIACFLFAATSLAAQDKKTVTKALDAKQLDKAQQAVDAFVAKDEKNAEAWYLKSKVYTAIAESEQYSKLVPNSEKAGWEALKKYAAIDKTFQVAMKADLLTYQDNFQFYYKKFINNGSANLDAKNYSEALNYFKSALSVSAFFYDNKWSSIALDTTIVFYTGYTAMKGEMKEDAEVYFNKLAAANAYGTDLRIAYGWLANYYTEVKKDTKKGLAYAEQGLKFYPTDDYLIDQKSLAIATSGDINAVFANHEVSINKPNAPYGDYLKYGIDLYGYLYDDSTAATTKKDFAEKQTKFEVVMGKGLALKPNNAEGNYLMGFHHGNKVVSLEKQIKAYNNKKTPADIAAKKALEQQRDAQVDAALKNLSLCASIYKSKMANIKENELRNYKSTLANLIVFNNYKSDKAKVTQYKADLAELK